MSLPLFSESTHDYIQVYNNGIPGTTTRFSGNRDPFSFVSYRNDLWFLFRTDHSVQYRGFNLDFQVTLEPGQFDVYFLSQIKAIKLQLDKYSMAAIFGKDMMSLSPNYDSHILLRQNICTENLMKSTTRPSTSEVKKHTHFQPYCRGLTLTNITNR